MAKESHINFADAEQPELVNLSTKLLEKCNEEKLSIPKLAEILGLGEMTVRRIIHQTDGYSPNIKILYPIADYFGCSLPDLLSDKYSIQITGFSSLDNFQNNIGCINYILSVPKSIYIKAKYNQLIYIKFFHDLGELFLLTNELPTMQDPFGCIIILDEKLHFGYLSLNKKSSTFQDLTDMRMIELLTNDINLIAIKEDSTDIPKPFSGYIK
jgi:transcriptional regulator with XRE-family HTH domain